MGLRNNLVIDHIQGRMFDLHKLHNLQYSKDNIENPLNLKHTQ